jgi:hypothetical protein
MRALHRDFAISTPIWLASHIAFLFLAAQGTSDFHFTILLRSPPLSASVDDS